MYEGERRKERVRACVKEIGREGEKRGSDDRESVYVCVCLCERGRERRRENERKEE